MLSRSCRELLAFLPGKTPLPINEVPPALRPAIPVCEARKWVQSSTRPPKGATPATWVNGDPGGVVVVWKTAWGCDAMESAEARGGGVVTLTPEEKTILETLANENGMTVTQEALAGQVRLADRTVRKYLREMRERGLVDQPRGTKKGYAATPAGLAAIGRK